MSNPAKLFKEQLIQYFPEDQVARGIIWDLYTDHKILQNCPNPALITVNRREGVASCGGLEECQACGIKIRS